MLQILVVAVGGAAGAVARFVCSSVIYGLMGKTFPWGTLFVNVVGSFLMGVGATLVVEKVLVSAEWRNALLIGFLGAFTTFSTFSLDTLNLIYQGQQVRALANVLVSVTICVLATWAGASLVKQL